jgi:hypothetical protein
MFFKSAHSSVFVFGKGDLAPSRRELKYSPELVFRQWRRGKSPPLPKIASHLRSQSPFADHNPLKAKKVKVLFDPMLPDLRKSIAFSKVSRLRSFGLVLRATCKWRWLWRIGGMILRGENWSTRMETSPSATLSTTNPTRTGFNCI